MTDYPLTRRGFQLGKISSAQISLDSNLKQDWNEGRPYLFTNLLSSTLVNYQEAIAQSESLVESIYEGVEPHTVIESPPYSSRLANNFDSLGSTINEGDDQEIEAIMFDAVDGGNVIAEDLWIKASWLSFHEEDASVRFRFSFGMDLVEDVAADSNRQQYAALLADAIFPESAIITQHKSLRASLCQLLDCSEVDYVERIVYFNAPNGGAYLHHDLERGHAGVVFAQLTGKTFWLALPKHVLVKEICDFVSRAAWPDSVNEDMQEQLLALVSSPDQLAQELDSFCNDTVIHLINETPDFVQFLVDRGHGFILNTGDVLLLPQTDSHHCCWHSVFCLGEEVGQGLSFAIKPR